MSVTSKSNFVDLTTLSLEEEHRPQDSWQNWKEGETVSIDGTVVQKTLNKGVEEFSIKQEKYPKRLILGVDPGKTNFASVAATYHYNPDSKTFDVEIDPKRISCVSVIPNDCIDPVAISQGIYNWSCDHIFPYERNTMTTIILEQQPFVPVSGPKLNVQMHSIQMCLYTLMKNGWELNTSFVRPQNLKKHLDLSMGDHAKNKKEVVKFAKKLFPMEDRKFITNDHVADAIVLIYYYLQEVSTNYEGVTVNMKFLK